MRRREVAVVDDVPPELRTFRLLHWLIADHSPDPLTAELEAYDGWSAARATYIAEHGYPSEGAVHWLRREHETRHGIYSRHNREVVALPPNPHGPWND